MPGDTTSRVVESALDALVLAAQQSVNASGMGRTINCAGSTVLPRRRSSGEFADRGKVVHAFLERVLNLVRGGAPLEQARELALLEVPDEDLAGCEVLDLNALSLADAEMEPEVWMALDWREWTARRVRGHEDVDRSREIPAVTDVVLRAGGGVLVKDYKTGRGPRAAADSHWQMIVLAICARIVFEAEWVDVELCYLDLEEGRPHRQQARFNELELDSRLERISSTMTKRIPAAAALVVVGQAPQVSMGPWCRYCPAFHSCPATQGLALVVGQGEQALRRALPTAELSDEDAAAVYWKAKTALAVVGEVMQALHGRAERQPFAVGENQVLGPVQKRGKAKLDGRKAKEAVLEVLGDEALADAAVELTATKKGIRKAVTPHCKEYGLKIGETNDRIISALEEAGGIKRRAYQAVEVYDPRKLLAAQEDDDE